MIATKNIIFDLGNVLYDIDFTKMNKVFASYGVQDFEQYFTLSQSHSLFLDLEKGFVQPESFYDGFRAISNSDLTNEQIKEGWNALLVGFRPKSIEWVKAHQNQFNTFLYSNTNQIHYDHFIPEFETTGFNYPFETLFKKPYYSHQMGQRKPDPASFMYILENEGLVAGETLFVDDNEPNIIAAASVGLKVLHLKAGMTVENDIAGSL